jgi:hypothetical protein
MKKHYLLFIVLCFLSFPLQAAVDFRCEILEVGRSFSQTKYRLVATASSNTQYSGQLTVTLSQRNRRQVYSINEQFNINARIRDGRSEEIINKWIGGIRATSCSVAFAGTQYD